MAEQTSKSNLAACIERVKERYQFVFGDDLIEEICKCGDFRNVRANTELLQIGQEITHIPIILTGSLKVVTEDDKGDELLLYYLELGDTCAMTLSCCTKRTKSAITAITEEETDLVLIPVEKMDEWMVAYSSWRAFVLESYNSRMGEMLEAIDSLAFHNMEQRLTKYLRDRAMVLGKGDLKITHAQIANDLHSSRVVISRLMKKLEMDGVITQQRNMVSVAEFSA